MKSGLGADAIPNSLNFLRVKIISISTQPASQKMAGALG